MQKLAISLIFPQFSLEIVEFPDFFPCYLIGKLHYPNFSFSRSTPYHTKAFVFINNINATQHEL